MIYNNAEKAILTKGAYQPQAKVAIVKGMDGYPDPDDLTKKKKFDHVIMGSESRFSPLFSLNVWDNILTDEQFSINRRSFEPTISNLLSEKIKPKSPGILYDPSDFMHSKHADFVSGYHMITLRRFGNPIDDNLMYDDHPQIDMGRLVTYSTEESNKLSDLMSMSFGMKWKELTADFWTPEIIGNENGFSGLFGQMAKLQNPQYLNTKGLGAGAVNIDPQYDQNKVYGPVDSITSTHIRNRGLNFSQDINLTFEYELRSYDGVNPKAAMIDLLSSIMIVTMNDAKFWSGAAKWIGVKQTAYQKYMQDNDAESIGTDFTSTIQHYKGVFDKELGKTNLDKLLNVAKLAVTGLQGFVLDKLVSVIGRPTISVMNSLLSGEPIGLWHVTIGNPFRPIMSIGNLILTNTQLSFGDTIGHDGFPTTIKCNCTLKHAKPRSRAEIEMMFNAGKQRTYWQPTEAKLIESLKRSRVYKDKQPQTMQSITNEIYSYLEHAVTG